MESILSIDFQLLNTKVSPKEISVITGITPDVALLRGERNSTRDLPRHNIWSVQSRIESNEVSDHWNYLKEKIYSSKESIRVIAKDGICRLSIIISGHRIPSIIIPPSMSEFAGYVNAEIDIDHLQN